MQRLIAFLDPWSVAFNSGYQLTQALIAFGRGELWGLGLGEGVQKRDYLPEAHNDFIYAVVAEELGSVGAIVLALVLTYLVVQIFLVARKNFEKRAYFAGVVAYFSGLVLGIQFLINLGVNTGVLPTKGLTLPFVSYGGNSLIICCALMALVLRTSLDKGAIDV
jgi:cell division protein FtsW